jgi:hypothetical protein
MANGKSEAPKTTRWIIAVVAGALPFDLVFAFACEGFAF